MSLSPAFDIVLQLCAILSILHSSFSILPSVFPSSINALLYHLPSHPFEFSVLFNCCIINLYFSILFSIVASFSNKLFFICSIIFVNLSNTLYKKNPSHTLSPLPLGPTLFIPSFQSPLPILGKPFSPKFKLLSIAFIQCSYMLPVSFVYSNLSYLSSSFSSSSFPTKYGVFSFKMLISPVNSIYSHVKYTSHNKSSDILVLIPLPVSSCHQCSTSPSKNCCLLCFII